MNSESLMIWLAFCGYLIFATVFYVAMTRNARYCQMDDSGIPPREEAEIILLDFAPKETKKSA